VCQDLQFGIGASRRGEREELAQRELHVIGPLDDLARQGLHLCVAGSPPADDDHERALEDEEAVTALEYPCFVAEPVHGDHGNTTLSGFDLEVELGGRDWGAELDRDLARDRSDLGHVAAVPVESEHVGRVRSRFGDRLMERGGHDRCRRARGDRSTDPLR